MDEKSIEAKADAAGDRLYALAERSPAAAHLIAALFIGWIAGAYLPRWLLFVVGSLALAAALLAVWAKHHTSKGSP